MYIHHAATSTCAVFLHTVDAGQGSGLTGEGAWLADHMLFAAGQLLPRLLYL